MMQGMINDAPKCLKDDSVKIKGGQSTTYRS